MTRLRVIGRQADAITDEITRITSGCGRPDACSRHWLHANVAPRRCAAEMQD